MNKEFREFLENELRDVKKNERRYSVWLRRW